MKSFIQALMPELVVREMRITDIPKVVEVHMEAFQNFFLSLLGPHFLSELYNAILDDPSGMAFIYEEYGDVVGFVAGTDQPSGFYKRLLKQRWWRFGLASILPALRQPAIIPRLLRAFKKPDEADVETGYGTLMSIAISPRAQGQGIGQALVTAFLEDAAQRGLISVNLMTDQENNEKANQFYRKNGFFCSRTFITPEGRRMNEYTIRLDQSQRALEPQPVDKIFSSL